VNATVTLVPCEELPWVPVYDGVEMRMLRRDPARPGYTAMFRFAPGTRLPTHRHEGVVHAFTLRGSWRYLEHDWIAVAGSYACEDAGSVHTLVVPEDAQEPTDVLFVVEGAMIVLDDEGGTLAVMDGAAMDELYQAGRAATE
jgi:2,4'-dihydroxyacetophenone dioxygenase